MITYFIHLFHDQFTFLSYNFFKRNLFLFVLKTLSFSNKIEKSGSLSEIFMIAFPSFSQLGIIFLVW